MMGTSLPPVPGRVVAKIKARQFVDFAELLADNAELLRRESERDYGSPAWSRPQLRQVPTIIAWVQAFASFAAVELQLRPERAVELMAYLRLLVRETMRCGSEGWRQYDTQFRQQAAADPNIVWSTLEFTARLKNACTVSTQTATTSHRSARCARRKNVARRGGRQIAKMRAAMRTPSARMQAGACAGAGADRPAGRSLSRSLTVKTMVA